MNKRAKKANEPAVEHTGDIDIEFSIHIDDDLALAHVADDIQALADLLVRKLGKKRFGKLLEAKSTSKRVLS